MADEPPPKFNLSSQCHNLDRGSLQTTYLWTREYSGGKVVASNAVYLDSQPHQPTMFERLLHTVAHKATKSSSSMDDVKSRQWQEDDKNVRDGTCTFQVQYLGAMEVHAAKGVQLCEDVIKELRKDSKGSKRKEDKLTGPGHHGWATMRITNQAVTVVDEDTQHVIVEDEIRSISFCTADRRNDKCFAYISRVSPTERRWYCHAFAALTATGERLNHAVGCAFSACSENANDRQQSDLQAQTSAQQHGRLATDSSSRHPDASFAVSHSSVETKAEVSSRGQVTLEMEKM